MTYNIKSGRNHLDGLEAVARVIESQSPDVLAVQEVDEGMTRTWSLAQTDWLTRRLRMCGLFVPAMELDGGQYGIALLSRWPIQSHERRPLFSPNYADASSRPRHDSEPRVVLGAVLTPTPSLRRPHNTRTGEGDDSRPLSDVFPDGRRVGDGGCALNIIVTHLGLTPDQRAIQIAELAQFARARQNDLPTIIMGDFNCNPDAPELAPLREHFQEACARCGVQSDERYTFPSGPLGARALDGWRGAIDHVWTSPDVQIVSARVVMDETSASDHQPLLVELTTDG